MVEVLSIAAGVAHEDTLEATQVATNGLADLYNTVAVAQVGNGIVVYLVSI